MTFDVATSAGAAAGTVTPLDRYGSVLPTAAALIQLGLPAGAGADQLIDAARARGVTSFRLPDTQVDSHGFVILPNHSPPVSQQQILQQGWQATQENVGTTFSDLGSGAHAAVQAAGDAASAVGTTVHDAASAVGTGAHDLQHWLDQNRTLVLIGAGLVALLVLEEAI